MNCRMHVAMLVAGALLGGCSALTIDVDVYKGPLLHTEEVQLRQYAYMAISAKPLIERISNRARERFHKNCTTTGSIGAPSDLCKAAADLHGFLLEVLEMYKEAPAVEVSSTTGDSPQAQQKYVLPARVVDGTNVSGIDNLTKALSKAFAKRAGAQSPEERAAADAVIRAATNALNESLILFAQRVLFVVNNEHLYNELGDTGDDSVRAHKAVLQSLGNTLLVHANDLSRQRERREKQVQRMEAEQRAIRRAFSVPPVEAWDRLVKAAVQAAPGTTPPPQPLAPLPDPTAAARSRLTALESQRDAAGADARQFRTEQAEVVAALQTLKRDPRRGEGELAALVSVLELAAQRKEREEVVALYQDIGPDATEELRKPAALLEPLREWLRKVPADNSERGQRIALTLTYLQRLETKLPAAPATAKRAPRLLQHVLEAIEADFVAADSTHRHKLAELKRLEGEVASQRTLVDDQTNKYTLSEQARQRVAAQAAEGERIQLVLSGQRKAVLDDALAAGVKDAAGIHVLASKRLSELKPDSAGAPKADDLELARRALAKSRPALGPACGDGNSGGPSSCGAKDQMDAVDELIASLRAQRVAALAAGDKDKADNLLAAINVAYEQRTAMVYLRPASDYLLSVYSASALQDSGEPAERNMLNDWMRNVWPDWLKFGRTSEALQDVERRRELEKLHWQSINRVTLNGGGFTNFVLAKDDVGNWYVKAYSSDPEAIFKSAFNLALFNTGARLSTNLLQRQKLMEQIDSTSDTAERTRLEGRLDGMTQRESRPLMTLRARYAQQYDTSTAEGGKAVRTVLDGMARKVDEAVESAVPAAAAADPGTASCTATALKGEVAALDAAHLKEPRERLGELVNNPSSAPGGKITEAFEGAIHSALVALHGYGHAVYRKLDQGSTKECVAEVRRKVASGTADAVRTALLQQARERRLVIERYEEALSNITDVAVTQ